jgi:hypothetical protein
MYFFERELVMAALKDASMFTATIQEAAKKLTTAVLPIMREEQHSATAQQGPQ